MIQNKFHMDGPIPGENYTSDTKNYPWHRPPQHDDLDAAIEETFHKLLSKDGAVSVLTFLEMGVSCVSIADMVVTSGIAAGKWTVDYGLLMAGPVTHIIYMMGKGYGIKDMKLGLDNNPTAPSKPYFDKLKEINETRAAKLNQMVNLGYIKEEASQQNAQPPTDVSAPDQGGASPDEQNAPANPAGGFMGGQ